MRPGVIWFGLSPEEGTLREFHQRSLLVAPAGTLGSAELGRARGAVFRLQGTGARDVAEALSRHARTLIDHGLRVELLAADDVSLGLAQTLAPAAVSLPGVTARTAPEPHLVAEGIARHSPGPVPRADLCIEVADDAEPLRETDKPLLRRAFAHCRRIVLAELGGGRSDARVFAVHMTVDTSDAGIWPQPAFAKIDTRAKIEREHRNYRDYADRFIPFGTRPNIHDMVAGADRALLVGNFVDRSESLWDLAQRNVAGPAVAALFGETLGGWRDQTYASAAVEGAVASAMERCGMVRPGAVLARHVEAAVEREGASLSATETWSLLAGLRQRYREAPAHGDLHGENVRVRNGQAILIDLASVVRGPLTADVAALETWLAFEPTRRTNPARYGDPEWAAEIDRLYAPEAFEHPPGPGEPTGRHCWISTAVRQLRQIGAASQCCASEYQSAIAAHLLRRCQWDDGTAADRYRRAKGYAVAERLARDLATRSAM